VVRQPKSPPEGFLPATLGPDGIKRATAEEERINQNFAAWLSSPVGVECMAYLRSITIESAAGPLIGNDELRHREGQRFLVALMTIRKALHEKAQRRAHTSLSRIAADLNADRAGPASNGPDPAA
jgi:hypothetical protein